MSKSIDYVKLAISIIVCQLAGIIGSVFTADSVSTWYTELIKPSFNPPNWLFGPVWISLYILMGISLYLVWSKSKNGVAMMIFFIQLALNTIWSIIFFGLKMPGLAFIEIIFLWAVILLTIVQFHKIHRVSAYLLIPYILWVSFAALLNLAIYILN